jgi:hypothetical protein
MKSISAAIVISTLSLWGSAYCQSSSSPVSLFPGHLLFRPFLANHEEAGLSLAQQIGSSRLNIAIGSAPDLLEVVTGGDTLRFGPDLYAFALSNTIEGVLFKIAAADGHFGLHATLSDGTGWSFRFRAMHHSAHLVDGSYDAGTKSWPGGRDPFNYTRNFGEVDVAWEGLAGGLLLRAYSGIACDVWVRPKSIHPITTLHGVELRIPSVPAVYLAYSLLLMRVSAVSGTNTLEAGARVGSWNGTGARLFVRYFCGPDPLGAYYDIRREYIAAGFAVDLW